MKKITLSIIILSLLIIPSIIMVNATDIEKLTYTADNIRTTGSDGWSWNFNTPNGIGYYQFYSIRCVEYENYMKTEKAPPGPDAIVYADNN